MTERWCEPHQANADECDGPHVEHACITGEPRSQRVDDAVPCPEPGCPWKPKGSTRGRPTGSPFTDPT